MLEEAKNILNDLNATWPNDESAITRAVKLRESKTWNGYVNTYTQVLLNHVLERKVYTAKTVAHAANVVDVANQLAKWW